MSAFQISKPTTDTTVTTTGSSKWATISPGVGGLALWEQLQEFIEPSPVSGIRVSAAASAPGSVYVSKLSAVDAPLIDGYHFMRYLFRIDPADLGSSHDTDLKVQLRQGYVSEGTPGTLIHEDVWHGTSLHGSNFIHQATLLADAEAATITDYTDLWLRVVGLNVTESDTVDLYSFYMTVPAVNQATSNIKRTAKAPIWYAEVATSGTINGEPVIQLRNDGPKKAVIRELYILGANGDGGSTSLCRADLLTFLYTSLPSSVGPGGTRTTANAIRMDDDGPAGSTGLVVSGIDFSDWQQTGWDFCSVRTVKFLEFRPGAGQTQANEPDIIRAFNGFPIGIMPGDAVEIRWAFNGPGFVVRVFVVWEDMTVRA